MDQIELGLDTFGDVTNDETGRARPQAAVLRDVVEQAVLADQLGLAFIGLGEHHRKDFSISSPEIVLGRGSFTESYPLFGFDLQQYELLAQERIDLLAALLKQQPVTWSGRT